jgi:hypothetical protein
MTSHDKIRTACQNYLSINSLSILDNLQYQSVTGLQKGRDHGATGPKEALSPLGSFGLKDLFPE